MDTAEALHKIKGILEDTNLSPPSIAVAPLKLRVRQEDYDGLEAISARGCPDCACCRECALDIAGTPVCGLTLIRGILIKMRGNGGEE